MLLRLSLIGIAATAVTSFGAPLASVTPLQGVTHSYASHCDITAGRGASLHDYIVPIVTGVGAVADRARASSKLPVGSAGIVTVVTDDSVCNAVYNAQVLLKHGGDSTLVGPLGLVQVGSTRYVVEDLSRSAGEWTLLDVYDTNLDYLVSITR